MNYGREISELLGVEREGAVQHLSQCPCVLGEVWLSPSRFEVRADRGAADRPRRWLLALRALAHNMAAAKGERLRDLDAGIIGEDLGRDPEEDETVVKEWGSQRLDLPTERRSYSNRCRSTLSLTPASKQRPPSWLPAPARIRREARRGGPPA